MKTSDLTVGEGLVDIHCHCLPDMDDGACSWGASLRLCGALVTDGIRTVVASPHQLGQYDGRNHPDEVRRSVDGLNELLKQCQMDLRVLIGAEVRLDERVVDLVAQGEVNTLSDAGKYLLLELTDVPVACEGLIEQLVDAGIRPIIAHPERHAWLAESDSVQSLIEAGAALQVTAGALLGHFGVQARQAAMRWISRGLVSIVASDAHDAFCRHPMLTRAFGVLARRLGRQTAQMVCVTNPRRVVQGLQLLWPAELEARGAR